MVEDFSKIGEYNIINIFAIERGSELDYSYRLFKNSIDATCHYTEEIYSKGFFWLEVANSNANKRSAAEFLKDYLKINELVCFGDNLNDKSLFQLADEKYAVENAYKPLKDIATGIIPSNNKDGVARFLYNKYNNFKSKLK